MAIYGNTFDAFTITFASLSLYLQSLQLAESFGWHTENLGKRMLKEDCGRRVKAQVN